MAGRTRSATSSLANSILTHQENSGVGRAQAIIAGRVPRTNCPDCGVHTIHISWLSARWGSAGICDARQPYQIYCAIRAVIESNGAKIKWNTFLSPNLRVHVERFIQTLKVECLNHFVIVAERHLKYVCRQSSLSKTVTDQRAVGYRNDITRRVGNRGPMRDNDTKFTAQFDSVIESSGNTSGRISPCSMAVE